VLKVDFENVKDGLLSVAETGLKFAKQLDKKAEFELFLYYRSTARAQISQGVVTSKDGIVAGNAVRAARGRRVGFACSSGISTDRVKSTVKEALAVADKVTAEDDKFQGFCEPKRPGRECSFSKEILSLDVGVLLGHCEKMIDEARQLDPRIKVATGRCSASWGGFAVVNSHGVQSASSSGRNSCAVDVMSIDGDERKSASRHDAACDRLFNVDGLGQEAAREAVQQHGAKKLDSTLVMPTLWKPEAAASYIFFGIGQGILGSEVVKKTSPLCDRIGDLVAGKGFQLEDDGQRVDGLGTESIDDEGLPQQRNTIVDSGVLRTFLFNSYYGRAFGTGSTGNCSRGDPVFGGEATYESSVAVFFKNLIVGAGTKSLDDLIASVDGKAVLIVDQPIGIVNSDAATGQFSVVANSAYLIDHGSVGYPLQPVSVAGQFYDGLKSLVAIGNDVTQSSYGPRVPSLLFDGFSVVG
jgi:PmbA protein